MMYKKLLILKLLSNTILPSLKLLLLNVSFILLYFVIVRKWRNSPSRKCCKLSQYVKTLKNFFRIEFITDLKIEVSSLQRLHKTWCTTSFHHFAQQWILDLNDESTICSFSLDIQKNMAKEKNFLTVTKYNEVNDTFKSRNFKLGKIVLLSNLSINNFLNDRCKVDLLLYDFFLWSIRTRNETNRFLSFLKKFCSNLYISFLWNFCRKKCHTWEHFQIVTKQIF